MVSLKPFSGRHTTLFVRDKKRCVTTLRKVRRTLHCSQTICWLLKLQSRWYKCIDSSHRISYLRKYYYSSLLCSFRRRSVTQILVQSSGAIGILEQRENVCSSFHWYSHPKRCRNDIVIIVILNPRNDKIIKRFVA